VTISSALVPLWLAASLWLALLLCCCVAAGLADWAALRRVPSRYHLLFGGVLACVMLWLMSVRVVEGLWFHLLGVTTLTLILGWRLAMLAGTVAVVAHTLLLEQAPAAIAPAWLLTVATPASVTLWLVRALRRLRSRNLFIYMLGAGFGGGLLSVLAVALAALLLLWISGLQSLALGALANWPVICLLMFSEGFINGMLVTTLAVFYPELLRTLDDDYYLGQG
jgi:uncharacterized membrane protein